MYIIDGIAYAGEPAETIKVTEVKVIDRLCLMLTFSTGEKRIFDAQPLLRYPVYASLQDAEVFNGVRVEGSIISWADGAMDIAPETLYEQSVPYECQAWA